MRDGPPDPLLARPRPGGPAPTRAPARAGAPDDRDAPPRRRAATGAAAAASGAASVEGRPGEPARPGAPRRSSRARRARRTMWPATAAVVSLGAMFVTLFPVRAYLDQRADIRRASATLAELEATNAALDQRVAALGTDEEIERAARAQLNLTYAGEEAFALLPPQFPTDLPDVFPYGLARQLLQPTR